LDEPLTFGDYLKALSPAGMLVRTSRGVARGDVGETWMSDASADRLISLLHSRIQFVGELLHAIAEEPRTIQEMLDLGNERFRFGWTTLHQIRQRNSWLAAADMIVEVGDHRWQITEAGRELLASLEVTDPIALWREIDGEDELRAELSSMPAEIAKSLEQLKSEPRLHASRGQLSYIPAPGETTTLDSLRRLAEAGLPGISRDEFVSLCHDEFSTSASSATGALTTMRTAGLYESTAPGQFRTTRVAREWLETADDVNLIRILHTRIRFVGELLAEVESTAKSTDLREIGRTRFQVNDCRTVIALLEHVGAIRSLRYLTFAITPLGRLLRDELPVLEVDPSPSTAEAPSISADDTGIRAVANDARRSARDPHARGLQSGKAFEDDVAALLDDLGFRVSTIGGSGDTDILVGYRGPEGLAGAAIVDTKSKSGGTVQVGDVSDASIDNHRAKHAANAVAIVGPGFAGDGVDSWAKRKSIALISVERLIDTVQQQRTHPLDQSELAALFRPGGEEDLASAFAAQERRAAVIEFVVAALADAERLNDPEIGRERLSRDIYMTARGDGSRPTLSEIGEALEFLAGDAVGLVTVANPADKTEHRRYSLAEPPVTAVRRLRAWAAAIESGSAR
jgi:hypothetical protein